MKKYLVGVSVWKQFLKQFLFNISHSFQQKKNLNVVAICTDVVNVNNIAAGVDAGEVQKEKKNN